MCGIVGAFLNENNSVSPQDIKRMTNAIVHRGPDDYGIYTHKNVGLGHRRLSILDLSYHGHQPMISKDGRYVITYNGEIYNYLELKSELQSKGYIFYSNTDTEVVLNGFIEYNIKIIDKLNGMFAFAIYDRNDNILYLARDRYGIKPLYYKLDNAKLLFASEIKALFQWNFIKKEIDLLALDEYMSFQNIFTDRTLYEGIKILKPGHYAIVKSRKNEIVFEQYKYWDFNLHDELQISEDEAIEELERLFIQAVKRQLISDVPLGSYLSGGMDSGSIVAIASRSLKRLKTFTCGYDMTSVAGFEAGFDERQYAEMISNTYKTEQYEVVLHEGDLYEVIDDLVYHLDYPRLGMSYSNYYIANLASKFVKVVLSGAGGDELFAGYPWRYYHALGKKSKNEFIDSYYNYWQRLVKDDEKNLLYTDEIKKKIPKYNAYEAFKYVFKEYDFPIKTNKDLINASLYFELKTFLHGLLIIEDKISMAHSLETRVPFLDNDLVDFATKIPLEYKLKNYEEYQKIDENEIKKKDKYFETNIGKNILRKVMKKFIPNEIIERKKQGFSSPDASWYRAKGKDYLIKFLNKPNNTEFYNYINKDFVIKTIDKHFSGQNKRLLLWSFLNLSRLKL
ncbi:asparagine synthase (glutamine-hydrolyzing) [Thermosipho japonicus]|uniref:asparagine synthase (glutamine-hydrolyzing) n=1 Tax=Thermosipho japonicus TaxID=90323 RepID=A0A841GIA5_9BACT|nr:asparagine synthase (glutamine-hydrolyzing) [Thermosipho japonicus]MBB6062107.1 asparagine synthase (glutamine-hydrolyzing) [Thermosipho japonicus]